MGVAPGWAWLRARRPPPPASVARRSLDVLGRRLAAPGGGGGRGALPGAGRPQVPDASGGGR